uniref:Uncharacterized protein n=1 Tax=Heterosigma akashiwo TaxID=2829 RepID=A0A7S3USR2_HETAK
MNDLSFAHEIGHSFGLGHDFCNSGRNTTFFVDAHGYRRCPGNRNNREEGMQSIRTIMSYDCGLCSECTECDTASGQLRTPGAGIEEGILIPYFSNPNVYFQGAPIGFPSVQQLLGEKEEEEEKGNEPLFEPRGGNLVQKKISSNSIRDSDKKDLLPLSSGADNARVMSITRHFVANFRNAFNNKTLDSTTRAQYCPIPDFNPPNISTAMQALDCKHLTLQSYIRKSLVFACQMEDFIFTASLLAMTMFLCAIICIMIVRTSGRR